MNKIYIKAYTLIISLAIAVAIIIYLVGNNSEPKTNTVNLNDEEYLIYPGDSTDKWNIIFPSGDEYVELKPEQIAFFLKSGEINPDTAWVLHPQSEYQLTIEEDYIIVSDFNRQVAQLPLNQIGKLGNILIKDNE